MTKRLVLAVVVSALLPGTAMPGDRNLARIDGRTIKSFVTAFALTSSPLDVYTGVPRTDLLKAIAEWVSLRLGIPVPEPRRVCRRLRTLRGRSHDEEDIDEILT